MRKISKILFALAISIILYFFYYFLTVKLAGPEEFLVLYNVFIFSVFAGLVAIPIGSFVIYFIRKNEADLRKGNFISASVALLWGILFGWITISGFVVGTIIFDRKTKERKNKGKQKNMFSFENIRKTDWIIIAVVAIILAATDILLIEYLNSFSSFQIQSSFVIIVPLFYLLGVFFEEMRNKKDKTRILTSTQKFISVVLFLFFMVHVAVYFLNSSVVPYGSEEKDFIVFEERYVSGTVYYQEEIVRLEQELISDVDNREFDSGKEKLSELEEIYTTYFYFVSESCERARNSSINLNKTLDLRALQTLCKWEVVLGDCYEEKVNSFNRSLDFIENLDKKNYEDCLDVHHPARQPGNCVFLDIEFGYEYSGMTDAQAANYCRNLFPS